MVDNRGQMRTVEAFLSILILFAAFGIVTLASPTLNTQKASTLRNTGLQALLSIDDQGELGKLIIAKNWTALTTSLQNVLPAGVCFNLTVLDENITPINDMPITNGIAGRLNIVTIQYPCVSLSPQSRHYLLRLQLAIER